MNRRLYRSPDDRVLAGVAGGMAETYNFDPAVTRVLWALLILFTGGAFLVIYIVMALVVPLRPAGERWAYDETAGWAAGPPSERPAIEDSTTQPSSHDADNPPPATPYSRPRPPRSGTEDNNAPVIIGAVLILIGGLFLLRQFVAIDFGQLWPIAVIVIGLVLIVSALGRGNRRR